MPHLSFLSRQLKGRNILRSVWGSCRVRSIFLFCVAAATLAAQSTDSESGSGTKGITAASQFFDHDFVNFFVYGNGVWDSGLPTYSATNQLVQNSSFGWEAGGGVNATRSFKDGGLTINYRGSYREFQNGGLGSGESQSLSLAFNKRLNRRWTFSTDVSGGILEYGTSYYSGSSLASTTSGSLFGSQTRFLNAGLSVTYAQTRRLSYVFSGNFLLNSYDYAGAFSSRGGNGSASVLYRVTAKTTVGGTYSRTYFWYSQNGGSSTIDSGSLTLSHKFPDHWQLDLSAGVNRSHSSGTITIPVSTYYDGALLTGYYTGPYNRTLYTPVFQGVLTHSFRRSSASIAGGQSIMAGNGLFLTSKNQFANGAFSFSSRHSNLSFGGNFVRLSSVSNTVSQTYSYYGASASYGINLVRYLSANTRFDLVHYANLFSYGSFTESRVSFGLSLSTKSVPLTLF